MSRYGDGCNSSQETSNLAKPSCAKKTNLLVYKQKGGCSQQPKSYVPPISTPQMKRIKICTAAELKKICAPPPCPCPPKKKPPSLLRRLARLVGFGMKSAVALGAVYVTYDMGIWGDSETTGHLYRSICNSILPRFVDVPQERPLSPRCKAQSDLFNMSARDRFCCDKFPIDHESSFYKIKQQWNKTVTSTFSTIAGIPTAASNWTKDAFCGVVGSDSCKK